MCLPRNPNCQWSVSQAHMHVKFMTIKALFAEVEIGRARIRQIEQSGRGLYFLIPKILAYIDVHEAEIQRRQRDLHEFCRHRRQHDPDFKPWFPL